MTANGAKSARSKDDAGQAPLAPPRSLVVEMLNFFYPIHYRFGMDLEAVMCQGRISRKQAAILWLIHSSADDLGWVRRKDIETPLATWFEITNSNISKLLRDLTRPPLSLVSQAESPESGREKVVRLTPVGEKFVDGMVTAAIDYLAGQLSHLSEDELRWGIDFFALSFKPSARAARLAGRIPHLPSPPGDIAS
jgi:DNA-binding MarR family transcriptional regulator